MNFRSKVDVTFSKKVKLSINLNPSYDKKVSPSENFTNFARFPSYLNVYHTEKSAAWVRQNPQYASPAQYQKTQPRDGVRQMNYAQTWSKYTAFESTRSCISPHRLAIFPLQSIYIILGNIARQAELALNSAPRHRHR